MSLPSRHKSSETAVAAPGTYEDMSSFPSFTEHRPSQTVGSPLGHMDDYPGKPYTRAMYEAEKIRREREAFREGSDRVGGGKRRTDRGTTRSRYSSSDRYRPHYPSPRDSSYFTPDIKRSIPTMWTAPGASVGRRSVPISGVTERFRVSQPSIIPASSHDAKPSSVHRVRPFSRPQKHFTPGSHAAYGSHTTSVNDTSWEPLLYDTSGSQLGIYQSTPLIPWRVPMQWQAPTFPSVPPLFEVCTDREERATKRLRHETDGKTASLVQVKKEVIELDSEVDDGDQLLESGLPAPNSIDPDLNAETNHIESRPEATDDDGESDLTELSDRDDDDTGAGHDSDSDGYVPSMASEASEASEAHEAASKRRRITSYTHIRPAKTSTDRPKRHRQEYNRLTVMPRHQEDFDRLVKLLEAETEYTGGVFKFLRGITERRSHWKISAASPTTAKESWLKLYKQYRGIIHERIPRIATIARNNRGGFGRSRAAGKGDQRHA